MPCTFELSEEDVGTLDIEWVLIPADIQKKEETVSKNFLIFGSCSQVIRVSQCVNFGSDSFDFHLFKMVCV